MNRTKRIILRELELKDLKAYLYWTHPSREYHKYNGPYFKLATEEEQSKYVESLKEKLEAGEKGVLGNKKIIADIESNEIIGQVNWYWKSKETLWMEIGLVIFNENYWGYGLGFEALKLWIDEMFESNPDLVRIGLTTWSGNNRMMKLAEKLELKKEAVYRKARMVEGEYYDSVSYGILKEEWQLIKRE